MVFNSMTFAVFFIIVYGLYLATMSRLRLQNLILLVASCIFYGWWDYRFLGLIWLSTFIDWLCAGIIDRRVSGAADAATSQSFHYSAQTRRCTIIFSVVSNLLILGFFKYYGFFATSLVAAAESLGVHLPLPALHVILPVGISFYTFQSLSYTIDVYRGELRACRSLSDFALFVAFFPQLVAGPIVRAVDFLPQVQRRRVLNLDTIYEGGWLILWGLFKKVVIADTLACIVGPVFNSSKGGDGQMVLIAVYAFAVQIYCDFSGYTDIARGTAKMMGFEFNLNFNLPYLSANPREFWQCWHISLSTWLRDYLYIPLGGNRKGQFRTCVNLMATMLLGGLWHGAAWTYMLWGAYQGGLLVVHRLTEPLLVRVLGRGFSRGRGGLVRALTIIVFFHLTCLGWMIFRANSLSQLAEMLRRLLAPWPWWVLSGANSLHADEWACLLACTLPLLVVQYLQHVRQDLGIVLRAPILVRGAVYAALVYGLVWYGVNDARPFIYFQF